MDYPKRCPNRLMFNEETKECDWEDKVNCKGREKLIGSFRISHIIRILFFLLLLGLYNRYRRSR
jgi:hypothetical protein